MPNAMRPTIRVNGTLIVLRPAALKDGEVRVEEGYLGEQCEGCGHDICESGSADVKAGMVRCDCGETYHIQRREVEVA